MWPEGWLLSVIFVIFFPRVLFFAEYGTNTNILGGSQDLSWQTGSNIRGVLTRTYTIH